MLLTTFTTTLGLIRLYLSCGLMWEPVAVVIMVVGLMFGNTNTLLFIPTIYSVLYRVKNGADKSKACMGHDKNDGKSRLD